MSSKYMIGIQLLWLIFRFVFEQSVLLFCIYTQWQWRGWCSSI